MAETGAADAMCPLTLSRHQHRIVVASLADRTAPLASSDHFAVYGLPDDVLVVHDFTSAEIDNNICAYVAYELLPLLAATRPVAAAGDDGLSEQQIFESSVGAIVRSMDGSERRAWHLFYDNTLASLQDTAGATSRKVPHDFIADFRNIYRKVAELIAGMPGASVLDVATCFGFLPLMLAARESDAAPRQFIAFDHNPAMVALAEDYRRHRNVPTLTFICADVLADDLARAFAPLEPCFDIVTAIHLLEHLTSEETSCAFDNLWALTRRRLIIAVPFEGEPDPRFGHHQSFDRARLAALAARADGGRAQTFEHHGGWLIIDRDRGSVTHGERQP